MEAFSDFQGGGGGPGQWGQLNLDGSAVRGPRVPVPPDLPPGAVPYACWAPRGELDLWPAYVLGYEFPQETAMAYVQAFSLTGDPSMRDGACRWAELYAGEEEPLRARGGTYAQHYGMIISFFAEMADATGDRSYLTVAEKYAQQAIELLFNGKIFRGHPAKPYYEAAGGGGFLCFGRTELSEGVWVTRSPSASLRRKDQAGTTTGQ